MDQRSTMQSTLTPLPKRDFFDVYKVAIDDLHRTRSLAQKIDTMYVWNGANLFGDKWIVVKGAPNYDKVMRFLAFAARPQIQAGLAKLIGYAPSNPRAYDYLDKADAMKLVTYPDAAHAFFFQDAADFLPRLAASGAKVTFLCHPGLVRLCEEAVREETGEATRLPSGPLHDAAEMEELRMEIEGLKRAG